MSFFNSKEDVIEIELTNYGKKMMGEGKFSPVFYSFFDDDIIYDSNCYSITELQNNIQTRILNETPYLRLQTNFSSSSPNTNLREIEDNFIGLSLNNTDDSLRYAPAFYLELKKGSIKNVDLNSTKWYDNFGDYTVPQIYLNDQVIEIIADSDFSKKTLEKNELMLLPVKDDDTYVKIVLQDIIIDIFEENVDDLIKNFDIEVHQVKGDEYKKLEFSVRSDFETGIIVDDILLDTTPGVQDFTSFAPDVAASGVPPADVNLLTSYFNYSLDVFVQEEISDKRLFIYDPEIYIPPNCE